MFCLSSQTMPLDTCIPISTSVQILDPPLHIQFSANVPEKQQVTDQLWRAMTPKEDFWREFLFRLGPGCCCHSVYTMQWLLEAPPAHPGLFSPFCHYIYLVNDSRSKYETEAVVLTLHTSPSSTDAGPDWSSVVSVPH